MHSRQILFLILLSTAVLSTCGQAQDADSIWSQFTGALLDGNITADRLRPYDPSLTQPLLGYLSILRRDIPKEQWQRRPEIHRVGDYLHYIIPFTESGDTSTMCLTLKIEGGEWFFCHLENIFIRLDQVSSFPATTFPDLPESTKAWIREEKYWSFIVYLHGVLSQEKGNNAVLDLLKDGQGYFLEAKTWVPFVSPHRAFVLYLCWEQSALRGNPVVLEHLDDQYARVLMKPIFLRLYKIAAHLKGQISLQEYRGIYETLWHDRARSAGWTLEIGYPNDEECVLTLRSIPR